MKNKGREGGTVCPSFKPGMAPHVCNPNPQEAEDSSFSSVKLAWATWQKPFL